MGAAVQLRRWCLALTGKRVWGGEQAEDPTFAQMMGRSRPGRSSGRSKEEGLQEGVLRSHTRAAAAVRPLYEASHFKDVHIVSVPVGGGEALAPHATPHPPPPSEIPNLPAVRNKGRPELPPAGLSAATLSPPRASAALDGISRMTAAMRGRESALKPPSLTPSARQHSTPIPTPTHTARPTPSPSPRPAPVATVVEMGGLRVHQVPVGLMTAHPPLARPLFAPSPGQYAEELGSPAVRFLQEAQRKVAGPREGEGLRPGSEAVALLYQVCQMKRWLLAWEDRGVQSGKQIT